MESLGAIASEYSSKVVSLHNVINCDNIFDYIANFENAFCLLR